MTGRSVCCALAAVLAATSAGADQVDAARTLRIGSIVAAGDLTGPSEAMIGLEVRRTVFAGHPVTASDLGPPTLVRRNEIVTIAYRSGAIALRTEGRALGAGGKGELVEVMNLASRRTLRAVIVGLRAVEVRR